MDLVPHKDAKLPSTVRYSTKLLIQSRSAHGTLLMRFGRELVGQRGEFPGCGTGPVGHQLTSTTLLTTQAATFTNDIGIPARASENLNSGRCLKSPRQKQCRASPNCEYGILQRREYSTIVPRSWSPLPTFPYRDTTFLGTEARPQILPTTEP